VDHDEHDDGYTGDAALDGHPVRAVLAARFDPVLGRVVWFGRVEGAPAEVTAGSAVTIRTAYGESTARITERDLWGHWHLRSDEPPPFAVEILEGLDGGAFGP
jgi:hypothetical protein